MGLQLGSELYALVKAPWVHVLAQPPQAELVSPQREEAGTAPDAASQNLLAGRLSALRPGSARTGATLELPSGLRVEGLVEPADVPRLAVGQPAWARFDSESVVLVTFD
jgi:molybdopterin-binding protein